MACPICTERLDDELGAGACGHVFHYLCLSQWLCHKESCPQCRAPCKKKKILKLFMPEGNYTADDDESLSSLTPEQLKSELEACRSIIKNQDESLARTKQELEDTREEGSAWRCQYEALHKKHKIKETNYSCLTTQLKHLQEERDRTVKELEETRAKVEQFSSYKRMKDILDHSTEEAADMLKDGAYTRQELVKCLLTVKTRYGHAKKSKEATQDDLTAAEAKIEGMREHLVESVAECQSLRKENVTLTTRIDSLQKKVRMLEKAMESPESKRTLCRIFESPMPGPSRKKQRLTDSEEEDTSDVILLPDSPAPSKYSHLQEKAAEVGIDLAVPVTSASDRIKRHASYTKAPLGELPVNVIPKAKAIENSQKLRFGYNGLGGKSSFVKSAAPKISLPQPKLRFIPRKK